jgi:hypothetical protein
LKQSAFPAVPRSVLGAKLLQEAFHALHRRTFFPTHLRILSSIIYWCLHLRLSSLYFLSSFLSSIPLLLLVKQITLSVLPFYIRLLDGERRCLLLQTSPISSATVLRSHNSNQACTMLSKFGYVVALMAATAYAQNNNNNNNNNGGQGGANGLTLLANAVQSASAKDGSGAASFVAAQAKSLTSTNNFINFCAGKTLTNGLQVQGGSCNGIGKSKSEKICWRWLIGHSHGRYSVQK